MLDELEASGSSDAVAEIEAYLRNQATKITCALLRAAPWMMESLP